MKNRLYNNKSNSVLFLICILLAPLLGSGQNTFDLTSVEPDVIPTGVTIEWHTALPVASSNIYATPESAPPGLYYAVFNFGNDCYSTPSPYRIARNSCPGPTVDLTALTDGSIVPAGMEITYHTASPVSDANRYAGNSAAAVPGRYYLAYRDAVGLCYSGARPLIVLSYEDQPGPQASVDNSNNNTLNTTAIVGILTNDNLSDGLTATASASTVNLTITDLPAGSTLNVDGTVTASGQGTWTYDDASGNLSFEPLSSYNGNPTPLTYTLTDNLTCQTSQALVTVTYAGALPVTLVSFKADQVAEGVRLTWNTTNEKSFDRFEIEYSSLPQAGFSKIGTVAGGGSSYHYLDTDFHLGARYYRLKMVDLDGSYTYSRIVAISSRNGVELNSVYPSPSHGRVVNIASNGPIDSYTIFDVSGRQIGVQMSGTDGFYSIKFGKDAPIGVYLIKYSAGGQLFTHKFILSE